MRAYETALAIQQKLADSNPTVTKFQDDLAHNHLNIGLLLSNTGKPAAGLVAIEAALAIQQMLVDSNPTVTRFQSNLATSHHEIGILLLHTGKPDEAMKAYNSALAIRQKLADSNPTVTNFQSLLARSRNDIGLLLRRHREAGRGDKSLRVGLGDPAEAGAGESRGARFRVRSGRNPQ